MTTQIQPYLNFKGRAEEAAQFYQKAVGAQLQMLMRFKDNPETPPPGMVAEDAADKVMHMSLLIGQTVLMGTDGGCVEKESARFEGITLSLSADNEADVRRLFNGLADGGQVQMPLTKTFFSPLFGTLVDRFGVSWMVLVSQAPA